jgi:hypothetical protein
LQSFDAPQYHNADTFMFIVKLVYTGTVPIEFPVVTDRSFFVRDAPDVRKATISLQPQGPDVTAGSIVPLPTAYGSQSVTGSLITVQPGDSIIVRTKGLWNIASLKVVRNVSVKAELGLFGYADEYTKQLSSNTLTVAVGPR